MKFSEFMYKNRLWLFVAIAVLVVATLAIILVVGGGNGDPQQPTEPVPVTHTVTVKTNGGSPLANVDVYIYTDSSLQDLHNFLRTDVNGNITFTALPGNYAVVLDKVPAGYKQETCYVLTGTDTQIILAPDMVDPDENTKIGLGDAMCEMTITDSDGITHKISELLETKSAVVLNFWFADCGPCKAEFPYIQQAYEKYSNDIAFLALSPFDSNEDIAQYKSEMGLTFPMAAVDTKWVNTNTDGILGVEYYPTTIVIDRFGTVCLIHVGTLPSAETFESVFAYYSAPGYTQTVVEYVDDILKLTSQQGSVTNPLEIMGVTEFTVTVPAGGKIYCNLYRVFDIYLTLENTNATVLYKEHTYLPENGVIRFPVQSPDTFQPAVLVFGNTAAQEQTYTVKLSFIPGSQANPHNLTTGNLSTHVDAGNEQGIYYIYQATQSGTLTVKNLSVTNGVTYDYVLYNLDSFTYINMAETGADTLTISVEPGQRVQLSIASIQDASGNDYPAADFESLVAFEPTPGTTQPSQPPVTDPSVEPSVEPTEKPTQEPTWEPTEEPTQEPTQGPTQGPTTPPDDGKITFTVTITDPYNERLSGVTVSLTGTKGQGSTQTDSTGVATLRLPEGTYTVNITAPAGYAVPSGLKTVSKRSPNLEVALETSIPNGYTMLYVGLAFNVGEGNTPVILTPGEVSYFLFTPTRTGLYRFTCTGGTLSYWGNNMQYIQDLTHSAGIDYANNSFVLSIKEGHLNSSFILGIVAPAGTNSGTLSITRIGEPVLDITDQPWVAYTGSHTPSKSFPASSSGATRVDISAATGTYNLVLGSDGYYHMSANGPIIYLDFDDTTYMSALKDILTQGLGVRAYVDKADGSVVKEDYQNLFSAYVGCIDSNGRYPLTADLMHILKEYGQDQSWWNAEMNGYLIESEPNLNPEYAWMFACYYG
ncbi:MAG: redoxin domain-containing protein [Oscillospiraceae bacterium]|nr:redoxin domain-containing protein [Oscillospiraceae bacterium]